MNSEEKRDKTECHDFYKLLDDCKNIDLMMLVAYMN